MIIVGNDDATIEFDEEYGRIVSLRSRRLDLELVTERLLARNFGLLLPLPGLRAHYIWGHEQRIRSVERRANGVCMRWEGLESTQGRFDIAVTLDLVVSGSELVFRWSLDNHSGQVVEELRAPVLGGLHRPEERDDWLLHWPGTVGTGGEWAFFREFPGSYLGPADPIWCLSYPGGLCMPWIDLYNRKRDSGVYFGLHRIEPRRAAIFAEISPGTDYGRRGQAWPRADRLGIPVAANLGWATYAFAAPGTRFEAGDIVLRFHSGSWAAGADRYRCWYDENLPPPRRNGWLHREDAWQSTIISYPEDTVGYRFADLPKIAQAALRYGIRVLQVDGWHVGGIDRGYPQYTPDPRLGNAEELRTALVECRHLGVRVMLFTNLQVANLETEWWSRELHKYAVRDPFGHRRNGAGWEYGTILGLQGEVTPRMVPLNPAHPRAARLLLEQMLNCARLGADGAQVDKTHGPSEVDYHPALAAELGVSMQRGMIDVFARFHDAACIINPDFDVAAESHWDRLVPWVSATYSRFFSATHLPDFAYVFPEVRQSCCVTGPSDLNMVNNCLRFGHIINIEGRCLHGTAADVPITAKYAKEVLELRHQLRPILWDGRILLDSAPGLRVEHDGTVLQGRFLSEDGTSEALVLNHWDGAKRRACVQEFAGRTAGEVTVYTPGASAHAARLPLDVMIEPEQVVVIVGPRAV